MNLWSYHYATWLGVKDLHNNDCEGARGNTEIYGYNNPLYHDVLTVCLKFACEYDIEIFHLMRWKFT